MQTTNKQIHRILVCCSASLLGLTSIYSQEYDARYWFDSGNDKVYTCKVSSGNLEISMPEEGLPNKAVHQLNFQIKDSNGEWSAIYTGLFTASPTGSLTLSYDIDGKGSYQPIDNSDPNIDMKDFQDGAHHVTIIDNKGILVPENRVFFKDSKLRGSLSLVMESSRNNVRKEVVLNSGSSEAEIDVADLEAGIYPVSLKLRNVGQMTDLLTKSTLVNITPYGGGRVRSLYYWVNDSVGEKREVGLPDGTIPLSFSTDLDMSVFSVPTTDYNVEIDSLGIKTTPNFNVGLGLVDNRGFWTDTCGYYKDNGKAEIIQPVILQSGIQHDFGKVLPDDVLWAQIPVQEADRFQFMPRWESTVKWFDNSGVPTDTTFFDDSLTKATFTSDASGNYYAQIYGVTESIRDFSVIMKYLEGPSVSEPGGLNAEYEGIPIEWKSKDDWTVSETSVDLTVEEIAFTVDKGEGQFIPEVSERNGICMINKGNTATFSIPSGYIDRITLCIPKGYSIPEVSASEGEISIDRDLNIVVWEGLSKSVDLTVRDFYTLYASDTDQIPEIRLEKAYVRISEITEEQYSEFVENPEDFDYIGYNCLRVWDNGEKVGEYYLSEKVVLTINESNLIVRNNDDKHSHPITDHLILTYSYESDFSGVDEVRKDRPAVEINGEEILFSGLPAFVGIYSLDGRVIFQNQVDDPDFSYPVTNLTPGIYIIKVGGSSTKMLIK